MNKTHECLTSETQTSKVKTERPLAFSVYSVAVLTALVTFCVYLPALFNDFVNLDDYVYVVFNQKIASFGVELFRSSFLDFIAELWIPLTWISLAIDHAIWGLNPLGYHLTNNILHACNSFFVAVLAARLVTAWDESRGCDVEKTFSISHNAVALTAGLLFGIMPLHVESVAWVTERKDVLNAFFALPALVMYLGYVQSHKESGSANIRFSDRRYLSVLALFLLSLLSKSMTVTFPVVLLIIDWFPLRRFTDDKPIIPILLEKVPFLLGSLLVGVITLIAQQGTMQSFEFASPMTRLLVAGKALIFYLWKMVWPSGLMPFYVHPGNSISLLSLEYFLPLILVLMISGFCIWSVFTRRTTILPAVWLFYLITIFPVLGFSQSGPQAMADRFAYFPSLGPIILAAVCANLLYGSCAKSIGNLKLLKSGTIVVVCLILAGYGFVTLRMIQVWHNTETLWTRVIDLEPMQSGRAYFERGQHYVNAGAFEKSLPDLQISLDIANRKNFKSIHKIYSLRGDAYLGMSRYQESIEDFSQAIRLAPEPKSEYYSSRGNAFQKAGKEEEARRDLDLAEKLNQRH